MEIALNGDAQRIIDQSVRSGRYDSPEAVIHAALASLAQSSGEFVNGEWDHLLSQGEASIEAEGTLDGDEALSARRQRRAVRPR